MASVEVPSEQAAHPVLVLYLYVGVSDPTAVNCTGPS